eukprot:m.131848 g.131848  ORF g.131848 m.131848 type:complete len:80 (-) comp13078_c4_seq2:346-585(-)
MCKTCYLGVVNAISSWIRKFYPHKDIPSPSFFKEELALMNTCVKRNNHCPKKAYHHTLCKCNRMNNKYTSIVPHCIFFH